MGTVFIEDIDKYLLKSININGYVPGTPNWTLEKVPVTYHFPEPGIIPDFEHNLVSIFTYDLLPDYERRQSDLDIVVGQDETNNTVTVKKVPEPYKIFYQIDLWSMKSTSMVRMKTDFLKQFKPMQSILVPASDGDIHDLFMEMKSTKQADGKLWDSGTKQTEERFFRTIFRYCVHAELDDEQVQVYQRVKDVSISANEKVGDMNA